MLHVVTADQPTEEKQQGTSRSSTNLPLAEQSDGNTLVIVEDFKNSVADEETRSFSEQGQQVHGEFVIINQEQLHQRRNETVALCRFFNNRKHINSSDCMNLF